MQPSFTRTLKLKVRSESYGWLSAAATEVNQVFNYCNETSCRAAIRSDLKRKWLSGFDLCALTSGAAAYVERIGADTIQRVCVEYAQKRTAAKRGKLRWRVSRGARRCLGWVPLKGASLKRKGRALRFCGKTFRVFEHERLRRVVDRYQTIIVGDVSSQKLAKTRLAKSVLDSGWGILKRFLQYKGEHAGRAVEVVSERNTTRACSFCGALNGPAGVSMLAVRHWKCSDCGAEHERDENAARNILYAGLRCRVSVRGNELPHDVLPVEQDTPVLVRYGWGACYVAA